MAELPNLGKHCNVPNCNILDFLPIKCNACDATLCFNHVSYNSHNCLVGIKKDVQVPVCPLCLKPVPISKGELPDIKVNEHIDRDCKFDPEKQKKKKQLQCSMKECRKRELVPIKCSTCQRNFCLSHRHINDHKCAGLKENHLLQKLSTSSMSLSKEKKRIIENDEELAWALHASINSDSKTNLNQLNKQLAVKLQEEKNQ